MTFTTKLKSLALGTSALCLMATTGQAAQVITQDLIVQGSLCVGIDCSSSESFGFDTLRLKENNLRIKADDTSSSSSFPNNDWQITFNDSGNGGANKFSIDDITNNKTPFTIEANAISNALYVSDAGDIGVGTATPVVEVHAVDGNSPTLRLEQNGSSGFTPQTWDLAGNETNFFLRDVTNGSKLPFRVKPNTPDQALFLYPAELVINEASVDYNVRMESDTETNAFFLDGATGNVGLGTNAPGVMLHLSDSDTGSGNLTMARLENAGGRPRLEFLSSGSAAQTGNWSLSGGNTFVLQDRTNGDNEMTVDQSGNMTILGSLTQNSDKRNKMAIEPVNADEILTKVNALEVSAWTYKNDAPLGIRHIGPMAQDFYALFGTGANENGISTIDTAGVALAAIQALSVENAALESRLEALETRILD